MNNFKVYWLLIVLEVKFDLTFTVFSFKTKTKKKHNMHLTI